jgi:hypothetical protein
MRFSLLLSLIAALALGIIWLCAGRYLTLLVDRFITVRVASVRVDNLAYDGGGLRPLDDLRINRQPAFLS